MLLKTVGDERGARLWVIWDPVDLMCVCIHPDTLACCVVPRNKSGSWGCTVWMFERVAAPSLVLEHLGLSRSESCLYHLCFLWVMSCNNLRGQPLPKMEVLRGLVELEIGVFICISPPSQRTGPLQPVLIPPALFFEVSGGFWTEYTKIPWVLSSCWLSVRWFDGVKAWEDGNRKAR